jgi:hypothetical protein
MSRLSIAVAALAALLAGPAAFAQKKPAPQPAPAPAAEEAPCACPDAAPPPPLRESELAACRNGADDDGDGHVDCADQDCAIYAVCVGAPMDAPAPAKGYTTMRQLKDDLRARAISGRDFLQWQRVIRLRREAEFDAAAVDYHTGALDRAGYRVRIAEIRAKYEG